MFEVGFTEIVLILGLALLVLGPEKLPKIAAQIGRWTGRARSMARQLRAQLDQEVNFQERRAAHGKGETPSAPSQPSGYPPATPEEVPAADTSTSTPPETDVPASASADNDPAPKPSNE